MTTEEKAKAYDMALKAARKELAACGNMDCDAARQIFRLFPQLRESEDERIRKSMIRFLESEQAEGMFTYEARQSWISYLEKQKEKKHAEWSEEDEKMVRFYADDYDNNLGNMPMREVIENRIKFKDWLLNRLKSLRPQPKVELTLLDKKILEAAIAFIQWNDHFNCWGGIDKRTVIKALSSLKPSWKPSEEQIGALNYAYCELFKREDVGHNILGPLQKLLDDLNKLM